LFSVQRVEQEFPDLLGAAAGRGDLGAPLQRRRAARHVDDREAADEVRLSGFGPSLIVPSVATTLVSDGS
jgi:hypothetical protein